MNPLRTCGLLFLLLIVGQTLAAKDDKCITHPGQKDVSCLSGEIGCEIDKCSWCQGGVCMECKPNYFMDFKSLSCQKCTRGCAICTGPGKSECTEASVGYYLQRSGKVRKCKIEGCATCTPDPDTKSKTKLCAFCKSGYFGKADKSKPDTMHFVCKKCEVDNCLYCERGVKRCDVCKKGFKRDKGTCVKIPEDGTACKNRANDGACMDCPKGQKYSFKVNKCVLCPQGCFTCVEDNKCDGCKLGHRYDKTTKTCVPCGVPGCKSCEDNNELCEACLLGKFYDVVKKKCMSCHSDCVACSGPNPTDCLLCVPGKKYQSIIYVGAPDRLYKEAVNKMRNLIGTKEKIRRFIDANVHPFEERRCVDKCQTGKEFGSRFQGTLPSYSAAQCKAINVLHEKAEVNEDTDL